MSKVIIRQDTLQCKQIFKGKGKSKKVKGKKREEKRQKSEERIVETCPVGRLKKRPRIITNLKTFIL